MTDLLATFAEIFDVALPDSAGEDSVSHLPVLLGEEFQAPLREATVHHSFDGAFAVRRGQWKLIFDPGSGGWSYPSPFNDLETLKRLPPIQLYNLQADPSEKHNLAEEHPKRVEELTALMGSYVARGRSTSGAPQANDGETRFRSSFQRKAEGDSGIEFERNTSR